MAILALIVAGASAYTFGGTAARPRPRAAAATMQYDVQAPVVKVFGETKPYKFISIQPSFTVQDWTRARPIMEDLMSVARKDFSCMYCGWTERDDNLYINVAHPDGEASMRADGRTATTIW